MNAERGAAFGCNVAPSPWSRDSITVFVADGRSLIVVIEDVVRTHA